MSILAIDPGPEQSAWLIYDGGRIECCDIEDNESLVRCSLVDKTKRLGGASDILAIEMVASYGMPVGESVFETVYWIGRFAESFGAERTRKVYRKDVKMTLCHNMRAKDANIRQAIMDRYPATGGGKVPQIGTRAKPGPLYGIKSHIWSALAVAITYEEMTRNDDLDNH